MLFRSDLQCYVSGEWNHQFVLDEYRPDFIPQLRDQYPFTHNAGVNVPKQIINWLEGKETDESLLKQKNGVVSCKELMPVVFVTR